MSSKNKTDTTEKQMRRAVRREMPPYTRVFKDKNKYDRKAYKKGDRE